VHTFSSTIWKNFGGYQGVALTRIWPPLQSDIDSTFLPFIGDREIIELAEALARELQYV